MKFTFQGGSEVDFLGSVVKPGEVVEIPAESVGWVESRTVLDDDGNEVEQTFGEGVLAQPDLWAPVTESKTSKKSEES